jgi:hypothetical protein
LTFKWLKSIENKIIFELQKKLERAFKFWVENYKILVNMEFKIATL